MGMVLSPKYSNIFPILLFTNLFDIVNMDINPKIDVHMYK